MTATWSYKNAFKRNLGLIDGAQQQRLAGSLVAIPGCGGIGCVLAETLARLGVGRFRLSDPDYFDIGNFNRQLCATLETVGENKAETVKARILAINPEAEVDIWRSPVTRHNAGEFVKGCDLVLDGIDFFMLPARRALFYAARAQRIPAMTAAPLGFSASLQVFLPGKGMSFDEYYDFKASDSSAEQLMKFWLGLSPKGLHRGYMDMQAVNISEQAGPSSIIGVQIAGALVGAEAVRLLLGRPVSQPAPSYCQFDAYRQMWVKKRLLGGNRNWLQRLKLAYLQRHFIKIGLWTELEALQLG